MMRRILLIGLVALWAVGLLLYATWPRPKLDESRNFAGPPPALEQNGVFRDFSIGSQAFTAKVPVEKACPDLNGADRSACLQGYMVAQIRQMLIEFNAHLNDGSILKIPEWATTTPEFRTLWFVSLGMALDQLNLSPFSAKDYVKDEALFDYVVDGWAFANSLSNGLRSTLDTCSGEISGREMSACLFGAGRSTFFVPSQLAQMNYVPTSLKDGYLYSQAFNSAEPDDSSFQTEPGRAGRLVRELWQSNSKVSGEKKSRDCIRQKHFTDCKNLF